VCIDAVTNATSQTQVRDGLIQKQRHGRTLCHERASCRIQIEQPALHLRGLWLRVSGATQPHELPLKYHRHISPRPFGGSLSTCYDDAAHACFGLVLPGCACAAPDSDQWPRLQWFKPEHNQVCWQGCSPATRSANALATDRTASTPVLQHTCAARDSLFAAVVFFYLAMRQVLRVRSFFLSPALCVIVTGLLGGLSVGDINLLSKGYSEVAEQSLSPQRSSRGPSAAPSPAPAGAVVTAAADAETVAQLQAQKAEEPASGACASDGEACNVSF